MESIFIPISSNASWYRSSNSPWPMNASANASAFSLELSVQVGLRRPGSIHFEVEVDYPLVRHRLTPLPLSDSSRRSDSAPFETHAAPLFAEWLHYSRTAAATLSVLWYLPRFLAPAASGTGAFLWGILWGIQTEEPSPCGGRVEVSEKAPADDALRLRGPPQALGVSVMKRTAQGSGAAVAGDGAAGRGGVDVFEPALLKRGAHGLRRYPRSRRSG